MFGAQLLGAAAIKHTSKKRKDFRGKLDGTLWIQAAASSCATHTQLRTDGHVALPGKQGSTHVLLVSLQVAFPALLLLQGEQGPQWPVLYFVEGCCWGEHPGDHAQHCLDGLAELFPTDCLAIQLGCIHDRFTLLSSPQETCVTT